MPVKERTLSPDIRDLFHSLIPLHSHPSVKKCNTSIYVCFPFPFNYPSSYKYLEWEIDTW